MSTTLPRRPAGRRWEWVVIVGLWATAAVLSALQIYLRDVSRGFTAPWGEVLAANLLAWLPWLAIIPAALELERRFPVPGPRTGRHLAVHGAAAVAMSLAFLLYLAYFHAAVLEGGGALPGWQALRAEYAEKLGQHFLVAVMLYAAIVLGGLAYRTRSASAGRRERAARPDGRAEAPAADGGGDARQPLVARSVGRIERVDPAAVDWIEGYGNYARLHLGGRRVLIRRTLASLCDELGEAGFVRVHRSAIVNARRVVKLEAGAHGDATAELADGRKVRVSRTYRRRLEKRVLGA